ncbi:hypothetical protein QAD02_013372 [Eretmocerus hayati]|uniref:Uncharacterized protein n=1 Tax=Eretmocerus hayati TaxID=131215 RepID=A0ACC2P2E0_9HYME|nr:hypothetical protein QAD02_013372 [Eretmocerus hayati]
MTHTLPIFQSIKLDIKSIFNRTPGEMGMSHLQEAMESEILVGHAVLVPEHLESLKAAPSLHEIIRKARNIEKYTAIQKELTNIRSYLPTLLTIGSGATIFMIFILKFIGEFLNPFTTGLELVQKITGIGDRCNANGVETTQAEQQSMPLQTAHTVDGTVTAPSNHEQYGGTHHTHRQQNVQEPRALTIRLLSQGHDTHGSESNSLSSFKSLVSEIRSEK